MNEEAGVTGKFARLVEVAHWRDDELYGDMPVASYLVRIAGGIRSAGPEVQQVEYHTRQKLPTYLKASLQYCRPKRAVVARSHQ